MNYLFYGATTTTIAFAIIYLFTQIGNIRNKWKARVSKNKRIVRILDRDAENKVQPIIEMSGSTLSKLKEPSTIGMNSTIL